MEQIIKNILTKLISHPDQLSVQVNQEYDYIHVEIKSNEQDTAKIIGKHGLTIKAIGDLVFLYQQKTQTQPYQRVILKII